MESPRGTYTPVRLTLINGKAIQINDFIDASKVVGRKRLRVLVVGIGDAQRNTLD